MKSFQLLVGALAISLAAACNGGGNTGALGIGASVAQPVTGTPVITTPVIAAPTSAPNGAPTALPNGSPITVAPANAAVPDSSIVSLEISDAARAAIGSAQRGPIHILPPSGANSATLTFSSARKPVNVRRSPQITTSNPANVLYYGGNIIGSAAQNGLYISTNYINCNFGSTSCWGLIGLGQTDLGASTMLANILTQYIGGLTAINRYPRGAGAFETTELLTPNANQNPVISESDLLILIYNAALQFGTGYGHIYHVFLPPNTDTCIDLTNACYSPDNPSSFAFCAYHSSVTINGSHIVYTIEPYQYVARCGFNNGINASGGSDVTDSTESILTHELFEAITDPDVGLGWVSPAGEEVADLCDGIYTNVLLNATTYTVQSIWSDAIGLCTNG